MAPRGTVSLPRALSKLGLASRAESTRLILAGRVRVDGRVSRDIALRVVPEQVVIQIDGVAQEPPSRIYLMLNKPRGVVTTRRDPRGRPTVHELLDPSLPPVGAVGRLDQASEGLLLLTNDTQWANAITSPASHIAKVYHVHVRPRPDDAQLRALRAGVLDDGELLTARDVSELRHGTRTAWLSVTLDTGRNRQIRRMCATVGLEVDALVRVQLGALRLGELPKGDVRALTPAEVASFRVSRRRSAAE
jgi:23S rRNA pseudouridine2605 synthase